MSCANSAGWVAGFGAWPRACAVSGSGVDGAALGGAD